MLSTIFASSARRARIDFAETFASLDALFYERGLHAASIPPELALARGRLGMTMATKAFEGDRVARAVITHLSAGPLFAGLSVIAHPRPELDVPLLVVEMHVVPSGVTNAFFDACGALGPDYDALFRKPLSRTLDAAVASAVRRKRVPEWLDRVSSGAGARLSASPGRGHVLAYALVRYVERWLDGASGASSGDAAKSGASRREACDAIRTHTLSGKLIARAFGSDYAARYAALLWNA
jgi:hypothetical protein